MKILQVITSLDRRNGGPAENIRQSSQALTALGHDIELASLDDPGAEFLAELDFPVHALGPSYSSYAYAPKFVPWLKENHDQYDCVIVRGLWQYPGFGTRQALKGSDTPYYVFPHGMLDPWFKQTYPLKHLKKWLYWPWGEYRVLKDAKAVLFTCEQECLLARESFWLYDCNEEVVNYGTRFPPEESGAQQAAFEVAFPELRDRRIFLFLGRIHPKKGCDLAIQAFAKVSDYDPALQLVFAGPDGVGWQPELEELAESLGVADRITWTGMIGGDTKWGAMRSAEVFVLPSHQENFGIAVVEAMACGTPVLISREVNIWPEIEDDGAGLVGTDDMEGTVAVFEQWLQQTPEQRALMGERARGCFSQRFEIGQAARTLAAVLGK